jgi:hypothetical protein
MLHLVGSFEFVRHEDVEKYGETHRGRELIAESLTLVDEMRRRYFLSGSSGRIDSVEGRSDLFLWIRDGVLVGDGPLNNRAVDIEIRVWEQDGWNAVAEVVTLSLHP